MLNSSLGLAHVLFVFLHFCHWNKENDAVLRKSVLIREKSVLKDRFPYSS